mmetsp:Transcript_77109/g.239588  ORF Transcript_77109/g.239588 Transcript_77109/m.239588 type:complete len:174 (-) Transcript_77109:77-598(-)
MLDSGTSLLAVPPAVLDSVNEAMKDLRDDCSNLQVLPSLAFELGGARFSLPPEAYVAEIVGDVPTYLHLPARRARREQQCQVMLMKTQSSSSAGPMWILGAPFFRKYYTTFDLGEKQEDRAFYIAPHASDDCVPVTAAAASSARSREIRRVSGERIVLSLTAQRASSKMFMHL